MPASAAVKTAEPLFAVSDLSVDFHTADGMVRAVDGVSFSVRAGETLGMVGESGSGKTVSTLAAIGLLPSTTPFVVGGSAVFEGADLLALSPKERRLRLGRDIGVIFQDPVGALNPVQRIGTQIIETLQIRDPKLGRRTAWTRAVQLLKDVGVPDAEGRMNAYPHQFSGGMCQRVVIAIAMANRPRLIIADEPTTAVDATVQVQLLELLAKLQEDIGSAVVLITHDLGVVSEVADSVCLVYAGRVVESSDSARFFESPHHPYGLDLLAARPDLVKSGERLVTIPGSLPDPRALPPGCRFEPRCFRGNGHVICQESDPELSFDGSRQVACHLAGPLTIEEDLAKQDIQLAPASAATHDSDDRAPVFVTRGLAKEFPLRSSVLRRRTGRIQAVDGVDLELARGETLGLVGESGCGKSTTGRLILRLLELSAGSVRVAGQELADLNPAELRQTRRRMQIAFQDPLGSLNPRLSAAENIADPLRAAGVPRRERDQRVSQLLLDVGLRPEHGSRRPIEFSGGQRQRVGIARALSVQPDFIILDEPVAALDVSVQAQIINMLTDLQRLYGTAYVFISHDLAVVRAMSDRVAVMYLGRVVESGPTEALFSSPAHPYTAALIAASPRISGGQRERIVLSGEPPSPSEEFIGCRFRSRCAKATQICTDLDPVLQPTTTPGLSVACHHSAIPLASETVR